MADATVLTGILGTAAAVVGAGTAVVASRWQKKRQREEDAEERAADSVANWAALHAALSKEVERRDAEMARMRADYEQQIDRLRSDNEQQIGRMRSDYERQLESARARIAELDTDLAALRRQFGGPAR